MLWKFVAFQSFIYSFIHSSNHSSALLPLGIFKQHFNVHVFHGSGDRFHHDGAVCFTPGLVGILSFVVCMLRAHFH